MVTSTHLYDQAVTSSIWNMDIILQDKDIHGMEWYNGTIHSHYIHKYNANANESHKMQTFDSFDSFDCD